ncbi:MAG: hypothetical protein JXB49_13905 [Bacteroidales bacterium]|nr:hypothetical protein [Bacteroidales bacterium]
MERGNPVFLPSPKLAGEPQGTLLEMREYETGKSECYPVMGWIRVQNLPDPKGGRRPVGVPLRKSIGNLWRWKSK